MGVKLYLHIVAGGLKILKEMLSAINYTRCNNFNMLDVHGLCKLIDLH